MSNNNMRLDTFELQKRSDDEIREFAIKNAWNGEYLSTICKRCGTYYMSQDAFTKNAEIVLICKECFNNEYLPNL